MKTTKKIAVRRDAFTLIEMLVVLAIILAVAALAAAFAPRVNDNQKLSRAVDNLEQWLLTAKMRAKRDGLATGIRFVQAAGDAAGTYSQFQYIQQPEPLGGGYINALGPTGGVLLSAGSGMVTFGNVDFSMGGMAPFDAFGRQQWLVQSGDYLEINGGGVYSIWGVVQPAAGPANTLVLGGSPVQTPYFSTLWTPPPPVPVVVPPVPPTGLWQSQYEQNLNIPLITALTNGITNYRILRQPRILIGEAPLPLPDGYVADTTIIPDAIIPGNSASGVPIRWSNVAPGFGLLPEILFSPTGAIIGPNASSGMVFISVYDTTMTPFDMNRIGIIGVQTRTGFMGAYGAAAGAGLVGYNPFLLAQMARESGL